MACHSDVPFFQVIQISRLAQQATLESVDARLLTQQATLDSVDGKIESDPVTHGIVCLEGPHHEVHEGNHYYVTQVVNNVQIASPQYWSLTTPDTTRRPHFTIGELFSTGGATWELFRGPTITVVGAQQTVHNSSDGHANTTDTVVRASPTVTVDGTLLLQMRTGSGANAGNRVAGARRESEEIILARNTVYALKCTVDGNGTHIAIRLTWYEED